MSAFFKKRQRINIGIDIGTSYIKTVVIDKMNVVPELLAVSCEPVIGDDRAQPLKRAIANLDISNASVNTSISGPSTIVRVVEMPAMTSEELKSAAKFESEKYIPYKIDEVIADCVKIEDLSDGKMNVLLVAAKKSFINTYIELLANAGLTPNIIDIDSFAVMNAFLNSQKINADAAYAIVNIGAKMTNINIIKDEHSYLARDISIAGNDVTAALAAKLAISLDKAEALKINLQTQKDEAIPVIKNVLFNLMNEIRLSYDFYENRYGKNVGAVYVSGGSSKLEGVADSLKDIFNSDVVIWDPFSNININPRVNLSSLEPVKSSFAVCVGLGLREY